MLRPAAVKCLATSERATLERGTKACAIKEEKVGYYFFGISQQGYYETACLWK